LHFQIDDLAIVEHDARLAVELPRPQRKEEVFRDGWRERDLLNRVVEMRVTRPLDLLLIALLGEQLVCISQDGLPFLLHVRVRIPYFELEQLDLPWVLSRLWLLQWLGAVLDLRQQVLL